MSLNGSFAFVTSPYKSHFHCYISRNGEYCPFQEMDSLDISLIRDTRTGKYAKVPKDPKMRDSLSMGSADVALEDKTLTVCYGTDLVNLNFINFAANSREVAKEWCDALFQFATNLLASNSAPMTFLLKCYTKLVTIVNTEGKIPVRKYVQLYISSF
ncbi:hypothetical protein CAPTEDRAFT_94003 [Capitella teleta]|uniref:PLC-beta PH domain-containing protein n=1 Tax=Capitella teleta TaxID=283909 RepID=R7UHC8_CAPTE|nr:hypothetical protein CAPTEDRAFT_94003 [Capitella teleta]|eukprot:ELU03218.1 hypothetical protein CAPTEDRAFT_94003 [Capitella teleta]